MGRIAGVTAEETRDRLLASAASVFARRGYDGAAVSEIASEAGVTSGAIYSHFPSKAELFAATLHAHGSHEIERLLAVGSTGAEAAQTIRARGVALASRDPGEGALLLEALVAAKRHPDVAAVLVAAFAEREQRFAEVLRAGQLDGTIDERTHVAALARFVSMLALGSVLVAAMDLPAVDPDDWSALIDDLVGRFAS